LQAQTGQVRSPVAILLQTNASNIQAATARGVALAQWDVARQRPRDTVLAGPMYQFPLIDAVHQSAEGRMMLGDLLALVYDRRVTRGEDFQPLHPVDARRLGNTVVIDFKRPAGSLPLQWDREWVAPSPDFGFDVEDEHGPVKIDGIEISGPSQVTIRLDRPMAGGHLRVRYAMAQPHTAGWAPGRGQLMAPTTRRSAFAGFGVRIPSTIAHYAIRFEMPVE
jgi:hypothetical protein